MKINKKEGHGKSSFSHLKSWISTHHMMADPGMPIASRSWALKSSAPGTMFPWLGWKLRVGWLPQPRQSWG